MRFDMPIRANRKSGGCYTTAREIWSKAPKAAARKATADGVQSLCIDDTEGKFYIYQRSGWTTIRGVYCDLLDEKSRIVPQPKRDSRSFRFGGGRRSVDWDALDYAEGRCLGDVSDT